MHTPLQNHWNRLAVLAALLLAPALAGDILTTGFEAPDFSLGELNGQNTWSGEPTPVVENTTVFAGSQAVAWDSTGLSGAPKVGPATPYDATGQIVTLSVEFMEGSGTQPTWYPLIADSNDSFLAQLLVSGGDASLGLASSAVGSVPITVGQWYDYQLIMDYANQTAYGFVGSTFIGSGPFANSSTTFEFPTLELSSGGGDTATGYFDNLSITATTVPEPSAFGLAFLGILPLAWIVVRRKGALGSRHN
jgi:hypothetical protein